ncbi:MAG: polysaccharide deacetylase family protein [Gammaproteobacteria bacterium]|nr:polysaccharide deacetylase family protein [Gammaproteobacteria bacterium]
MSLEPEHLLYSNRQYGMDHNRYRWSRLSERQPVEWSDGKSLALWINVSLQHFPLDQRGDPFPPPGGMTMPYPDLRHYSLRDYGNRVGIYRVLDALASRKLSASFAVNGELAVRLPELVRLAGEQGEIIGHGWNMDCPHYGGMDEGQEQQLIADTLGQLRNLTGQAVTGWLSPGRNESESTPERLVEQEVSYFCDWVNDDMPYRFDTDKGSLTAMPLSTEIEDTFVLQNNLHSELSWLEQTCDACDFLLQEAQQSGGGRLLALSIHPWLIGQPHRIGKLEQALDYILAKGDIWPTTPGEIVRLWCKQQY